MKAVILVSGGLDSTLAAWLMKDLGVEVLVFNLKSPFCLCDKRSASGCASEAAKVAEALQVPLKSVYVADEFFEIIKHPKHGFGSHMNPCIDCRILLFRKAKDYMLQTGASFIVTGEVLGQRPMSQHRQALKIIEQEAGLEGLLLRPLSAKLLPETIPEKEGWVSRDKLLAFSGRTRRPQMELARVFNLKDYPCSAGGCLLTDAGFSKRIQDLMAHGELTLNAVELLKVGRHFRFSKQAKLVVGRNEKENSRLMSLAQPGDNIFSPVDMQGPVALGRGDFNQELIRISCAITLRYCDLNGSAAGSIAYKRVGEEEKEQSLNIACMEEKKLESFRI